MAKVKKNNFKFPLIRKCFRCNLLSPTLDTENLISKLLLLGKYDIAVEMCIQEDRYTEAVLIANYFDKDLLAKTQMRFFKNHKNKFTNVKNFSIILEN